MNKNIFKYIYIFLIMVIASSFMIKAEGNELIFDGTQSAWAESELKEAFDYNLTYPDVMNNYKKNITREEFSTLVVRLYEELTGDEAKIDKDPFFDTNNKEVLKAYNLGIVNGKSTTSFAPNEYITRQEISVMIFRALKVAIPDLNKTVTGDFPFSDTKVISTWALTSVKFVYQNDILKGIEGNIKPLDNTTREQAVVLLKRTYESFKDRASVNNASSEPYCSEGVCIDNSEKNKGLIKIGYKGQSSEKVKVMIEKDGNRYVYPLVPDGKIVGFPLQMGNGEYKVSVLTNVTDNRYAYVKSETFDTIISNPNDVYMNSIQLISWDDESKAVRKNNELVGNETNVGEKIDIAYDFIINNISYDYDKVELLHPNYIPYPDKTIEELKGICYDYASLLAAMKRSEAIPVKLVKGYSTHVDGYHAWNEILINGEWVVVDTTVDAAYNKANMKFNFSKTKSDYTKVYEY